MDEYIKREEAIEAAKHEWAKMMLDRAGVDAPETKEKL